jgi:phosphatidate phosphatase PAH1
MDTFINNQKIVLSMAMNEIDIQMKDIGDVRFNPTMKEIIKRANTAIYNLKQNNVPLPSNELHIAERRNVFIGRCERCDYLKTGLKLRLDRAVCLQCQRYLSSRRTEDVTLEIIKRYS